MKNASIPGYFTNHSLHVTAATRLYDAQIDEATIMERTGHRSTEGVRAYKRTTDKLKELSSNVLNHAANKKVKVLSSGMANQLCIDENVKPVSSQVDASLPRIDFSNANNFTVNFNFAHQ